MFLSHGVWHLLVILLQNLLKIGSRSNPPSSRPRCWNCCSSPCSAAPAAPPPAPITSTSLEQQGTIVSPWMSAGTWTPAWPSPSPPRTFDEVSPTQLSACQKILISKRMFDWAGTWLNLFSYSLFIWVSIAEKSTWCRFLSSSSSVFFNCKVWRLIFNSYIRRRIPPGQVPGPTFSRTLGKVALTCSWKAMSWSREASLASSSPPRILSRSKAFLIASSSECRSEMSDLYTWTTFALLSYLLLVYISVLVSSDKCKCKIYQ